MGKALTVAESARMTQDVLERARRALHDGPARAVHGAASGDRAWTQDRIGRGEPLAGPKKRSAARTAPVALLPSGIRSALSRYFEFFAIGTCVIFSATAWVIHLIG